MSGVFDELHTLCTALLFTLVGISLLFECSKKRSVNSNLILKLVVQKNDASPPSQPKQANADNKEQKKTATKEGTAAEEVIKTAIDPEPAAGKPADTASKF